MERLDSLKNWLQMELASEWDYDYKKMISQSPVRLYHYTTIDGLMGIVKDNTLFASNALFLNDSSELHYGQQLIKEVLEQTTASNEFQTLWYQGFGTKEIDIILKVLNQIQTSAIGDIYVSCFTTQSDILSQWRGYANNAGIRIGFKRDEIVETFENVYMSEVDYNRKSQLKHIEQTAAILLEYVCLKDGKDLPAKDVQILPEAIASILLSSV